LQKVDRASPIRGKLLDAKQALQTDFHGRFDIRALGSRISRSRDQKIWPATDFGLAVWKFLTICI
jgi:hypothetical protein